MESKNLYVLSFCAVLKEDINSDSVHEEYRNVCLSDDKQFLQSMIDCLKIADDFKDLLCSSKNFGLPIFEYRYRIDDFPLNLLQ